MKKGKQKTKVVHEIIECIHKHFTLFSQFIRIEHNIYKYRYDICPNLLYYNINRIRTISAVKLLYVVKIANSTA